MENLKELEQKYLELGKEIEALKKQSTEKKEFEYPIYCKLKLLEKYSHHYGNL